MRSLTIAGAFNVRISITSLVTESSKHIVVVFPNCLLGTMQQNHFLIQHSNNCLQMQVIQSSLQNYALKCISRERK